MSLSLLFFISIFNLSSLIPPTILFLYAIACLIYSYLNNLEFNSPPKTMLITKSNNIYVVLITYPIYGLYV